MHAACRPLTFFPQTNKEGKTSDDGLAADTKPRDTAYVVTTVVAYMRGNGIAAMPPRYAAWYSAGEPQLGGRPRTPAPPQQPRGMKS
jgi:hypothetical protein